MKNYRHRSDLIKRISNIFCVIIGITFIISGFTKAIDPWGTAIKFDEYFTIYGLEPLLPLSRLLAIWLCGAEMMMGCMILTRVRLRLISIFAFVSMLFFTIVTLLNVTLFPIEDCGCFGDAFYLTPLQSLAKNLIILPMVFTIWWRYRPDKILVYKRHEVVLATAYFFITMSFSAYNYFHLPIIDFTPYTIGVNIIEQIESNKSEEEFSVILVYRNISTGKIKEFSIEDTQWQDPTQWEWVDSRTTSSEKRSYHGSVSDFSLTTYSGVDQTLDILYSEESLAIITISSNKKLHRRCIERINAHLNDNKRRPARVIVATPESLDSPTSTIGDHTLECYHIDATTLKTIMRSSVGVIDIRDGVIVSKRSCIDI